MVTAASADFTCTDPFYPYCYSNSNSCDVYWASLKPLTFTFEANIYTIPPEAYTLSNGALEGHACSVAVSYVADSTGLYILGDTFIRNFVTNYDYSNKKINMAVNINAVTGVLVVANDSPGVNNLYIIGGCIIAILLVYCMCGRKKDESKFVQSKSELRRDLTSEF